MDEVNFQANTTTNKPINLGAGENQKFVFVCTFCQVFASSDDIIINHISNVHQGSIPVGVNAAKFVSKLWSLPDKLQTECSKKRGRPRKVSKACVAIVEEKPKVVEPVPMSDGLYWCKKCEKSFKKPRQYTQHICTETEDECESSDSDTTSDYRKHMQIDPTPWSRRLFKNKSNSHSSSIEKKNSDISEENVNSKTKSHWKTDPEYLPLFQTETERNAFEDHLNSIDYSCIDSLFEIKRNKVAVIKDDESLKKMKWVISYSCNICKRKMNALVSIRFHCLTHTDLKPFICPSCPYKTNTKGSLYSHMRIHTGNLFQCSQCDFRCLKRSHLLDHEETHSTVAQVCNLCKNNYKTVRSLIAHVKRYHNTPSGKKYLQSFSSKKPKETFIKCTTCQKRFKSANNLEAHCKKEHVAQNTNLGNCSTSYNIVDNVECNNEVVAVPLMLSKPEENTTVVDVAEDQLAEIVLSNLSEPMELYEDVFDPELLSSSKNLNDNDNNSSQVSRTTSKNDYDKNLNLGIIDSTFVEQVMCETYIDGAKLMTDSLNLETLDYTNEPLMSSEVEDNKTTAENELFKKCRRAPAYVCCVCSTIFICPPTLKAHLREHVNSSNRNAWVKSAEKIEEPSVSVTDEAIGDVCDIIQESSNTCNDEEMKLEELFSSSLDMMYYLPEVKVVVQNNPSILDAAVWDDFSKLLHSV